MPKKVRETAVITEAAAATAAETGVLPIQHISPGWGSSGYYSPAVLEQAATDAVIPAGTQMYADHPTDTEDAERPVRSVKDLVAVTIEDARLATQADVAEWGAEPGALVSKVQVVPGWRDVLEVVSGSIGVSIRGSATDVVEGEAEGRTGRIIEGLVAPVMSVDFVTRAGRGGKVLSLLESARANQRAIAHGVAEATVNDTREALQTELRDAHGGKDIWVWVRDFDDTTVWFELDGSGAADSGVFAQTYTNDDGVVALTGTRTEVRAVTHYVAVTRPDSTNPTTEADQEVTMGKIQIEESEHTGLVEKAGRVDALESENVALKEAAAKRDRDQRAIEIVEARATEAGVEFDDLQLAGLLATLPVKEGALDEGTFTKTVDEAAAKRSKAAGAGSVLGFGSDATPVGEASTADTFDPDALDRSIAEAFGRPHTSAGTQIKES